MFAVFLVALALWAADDTIPAGTTIQAKLETSLNTAMSEVGDPVAAILPQDISRAGKIVVPRGSRLLGRVETIQHGTPTAAGRIRLLFREVEFPNGQRLNAWITNSFDAPAPRRNARYVIFMTAGALGGALIGGSHARVGGAIGGLLAGFVIAGSRDAKAQDLTLRSGQEIRLQFGEDLLVH
jgi:type F conjugative transfer system protein TrbI